MPLADYNVFLSYNSKSDAAAVQELAHRLSESKKLRPFLDTRSLVAGEAWEPEIKKQIARCETMAILIGPEGLGNYQKTELDLAFELATSLGDYRIIPVLLPGVDSLPDARLGARTYVKFRDGLDDAVAFKRLVAGIQGVAPEDDSFEINVHPPPYRGLEPFTQEHSQYFFGRELEIQAVRKKLEQEPFVAIVGASGAGKSSLVLGGVVPRLKQDFGPELHVLTMRPGSSPLKELAIQAAHLLPGESQTERLHMEFAARNEGLRDFLTGLKAIAGRTVLLVVDQLEELFTYSEGMKPSKETEPFLLNLRAALENERGAFRVLVTLRGDFVGRVLNTPALDALFKEERQVFLRGLSEQSLLQVIAAPARQVGAFVEKGLIGRLLGDVSREAGALPLLEDLLLELWRKRNGAWLTEKAYVAELGGFAQALGQRAQRCYEALSLKQQSIAQRIFLRLTHLSEGTEDTKQRVPRGDLIFRDVSGAQVDQVLQALAGQQARLLVLNGNTIEVAHEVLIREWPMLRGWLDENRRALLIRQRLAEAAAEWESRGRAPGYLYAQAPLRDAEQALAPLLNLLNEREREFLEESQRELEQQWNEKEEGRRELERQRKLSQARTFTSHALKEMAVDPQRALLLFKEAVKRGTTEFFSDVLDAWAREPCRLAMREQESWMPTAIYSPDGTRVLTSSGTGTVRIWDAASGRSLLILAGHSEPVWIATFSPDGARVLTASWDHTACLWDASSGRRLFTLEGHQKPVAAATFSPDGARVLTASWDHTACLWDAFSGQQLWLFQGHSGEVLAANFDPDGNRVITASADGTARLWNVSRGEHLFTLKGHSKQVRVAIFSPMGERVITCSDDHTARLWDALSGKHLGTLEGHSKAVTAAAFSPDGSRILTASDDHTARLWDANSTRQLAILEGHRDAVVVAAFSPDGSNALTASWDRTTRLWDATSGELLVSLAGHSDRMSKASFSPDGSSILTSSFDGTARIWDTSPGKPLATLKGHSAAVTAAAFSPDGSRVLTGSDDHTARLWDAASGKLLFNLKAHSRGVRVATFTPDGSRLLTASGDGSVWIWDTGSSQPVFRLEGHSDAVVAATFSPDGSRVLTASHDNTARIWEATTGQLLFSLEGHRDKVVSASFSRDGTRILTASRDKSALIWESASGRLLRQLEGHSNQIETATFSPDGNRVLTASDDHTARLWDTASGQLLHVLTGHSAPVVAATISPDGTRIVTASYDKIVLLWDAASAQLLFPLECDTIPVMATFSPNNARVFTASFEGLVHVWDATSGRSLAVLRGHSSRVTAVSFSPSGDRVLTASDNRTACIWPDWRWEPSAFAELDMGRELTEEERQEFLHEP